MHIVKTTTKNIPHFFKIGNNQMKVLEEKKEKKDKKEKKEKKKKRRARIASTG